MVKEFLKNAFQFSIRTKILFLGIGLIMVSFATYLPYILNIFLQDKKAYIYEAVLNESQGIQRNITRLLENKEKDLLSYSLQNADYFKGESFQKSAVELNLLQYERYDYDGQFRKITSVVVEESLRNHSQDKISVENLTDTPLNRFAGIILRKKLTEYYKIGNIPLLRFYLYDESNHSLHFATYVGDEVSDQFSKNASFSNTLLSVSGDVLESSTGTQLPGTAFEKLSVSGLSEGVITQNIGPQSYLIAFSKVAKEDWLAISMINENEAYKVSFYLLKKTLAFAGIIISLGIILSTFLAKSLTAPIDDLVEGTENVIKGNFSHVIPVKTHDELGQLGDSFNYMNKELLRYIGEVKEKSRMENELAVAQLVQSSFFPEKKVVTENFSVLGHYASASECGGDWWGTKTIQDKNLLFIADATGHGVPAALITATANCVANLLPQICAEDPSLLNHPARILSLFNEAVYKVGGKILMTFFIGIYDKKTKTLRYANASHNPPYLYRYSENEPQKSDISLLLDAEGERLGHIEKPKYTEGSAQMNDQDVLIMVTDGIIEAENAEKKPYGERRFIKSLLKHVKLPPEEMLAGINKDAEDFLQGCLPDDDVTLIIAKREVNIGVSASAQLADGSRSGPEVAEWSMEEGGDLRKQNVIFLSDASATLLPELIQACAQPPEFTVEISTPTTLSADIFKSADYILVDAEFYKTHSQELQSACQYPQKLALFSSLTDHQEMNEIIKTTRTSHLIGGSGAEAIAEMKNFLYSSVEKQFWKLKDFFGSAEIKHTEIKITTSDQLDQKLEKELEAFDFSKTFEGFKPTVVQVLNEMLTNALYNAPVDSEGNFINRTKNRKDIVEAQVGREPILEIGEDEQKIVFSVKDFYGTLKKEVIDHYLTHGEVAEKAGGAGVGTYLILKHSHKVVVNIAPGKMTEFIVCFHKFKRFSHYQKMAKSFHLFILEGKV